MPDAVLSIITVHAAASQGDFARNAGVHLFDDHFAAIAVADEVHELREHAFERAVVAVDHTGLKQLEAGFVAVHLHRALRALRDVDHDHAALDEFADAIHKPRLLRCIARTEGFEHQGTQPVDGEARVDHLLADARKEGEDHHVVVHQEVGREGCSRGRTADEVVLVLDVDAGMCQRGEVERTKGVEALGIDLGGAVAAHQPALEEDAHFGHHGLALGIACGGYLDARQEVFLAVGAELADGQLRTGDDDGLAHILEQEAQGRCGVGHGVGAVQQHETIIVGIVVGYDVGHLHPVARLHVGGVDGGIERERINVVVELVEFGHIVAELLEIEIFERSRLGIFDHADRSSRVYNEYVWSP